VTEASPPPPDCVGYIERTRRLYVSQPPYQWAVHDPQIEPPPWAPIDGPLEGKRVALISSGGAHLAEQEPFHFRNDVTHREIPLDADPGELRIAHFGYDTNDAKQDPACVLPLWALRELASAGQIGSVVDPALAFSVSSAAEGPSR
jgi:D-proline reductase (dithiol) PrdB